MLRQEMLDALTDHAVGLGELHYEGYSNGILSGCRLTTTDKIIQIGPGIIMFGGKLCLIRESWVIPYYPTDALCVCKLIFSDEYRTETSVYREAELTMSGTAEAYANEVEICRFKLQHEAKLRYQYDNFEDRCTEYDTLNTIYAPFAAQGVSTLSAEIIHSFAKELLGASPSELLDHVFCLQALGAQTALPQTAIAAYIQMRTGDTLEPYSNCAAYKGLLAILKSVKQGQNPRNTKPNQAKWSLTLD